MVRQKAKSAKQKKFLLRTEFRKFVKLANSTLPSYINNSALSLILFRLFHF